MQRSTLAGILICLLTSPSWADDDKVEAAVGGGVGGAVGAVVGDELGDRKGAIIGSAVGAAIGTAIATDGQDDKPRHSEPEVVQIEVGVGKTHPARHCPPGQAKKGRC